jgi:hypothetical protein
VRLSNKWAKYQKAVKLKKFQSQILMGWFRNIGLTKPYYGTNALSKGSQTQEVTITILMVWFRNIGPTKPYYGT